MMVRCCKSYEVVNEGDIGKVIKIDYGRLHDLNVEVSSTKSGVQSGRDTV